MFTKIIQFAFPGFILHELAHYAAAEAFGADAHINIQNDRGVCVVTWPPRTRAWKVRLVGLAPFLIGTATVLTALTALTLLDVSAPTTGAEAAAMLWATWNAVVFTAPSSSDVFPFRHAHSHTDTDAEPTK